MKNTGELVQVTKNKPSIITRRFKSLDAAKKFEADALVSLKIFAENLEKEHGND